MALYSFECNISGNRLRAIDARSYIDAGIVESVPYAVLFSCACYYNPAQAGDLIYFAGSDLRITDDISLKFEYEASPSATSLGAGFIFRAYHVVNGTSTLVHSNTFGPNTGVTPTFHTIYLNLDVRGNTYKTKYLQFIERTYTASSNSGVCVNGKRINADFPLQIKDFSSTSLGTIGQLQQNYNPQNMNTLQFYTLVSRYYYQIENSSLYRYSFSYLGITNDDIFNDVFTEIGDVDPNNQGGMSDTGGGTGSFSRVSDDVTVPSLPTLSAVDAGFVTVFVPTLAQLQSLASYMWSNLFSLDTLRKLFADPMDCIIGLQILPLSIPTSGAREIAIGNIGTGVSADVASTEYIAVDCGTISVSEYWGNCLDFAPTTKLNIYLPFVGTRTLNVDEIMGTMLGVVYHFDILSGSFICFVTTDGSVKYEFAGNSALQIPITGNDFRQIIANVISIGTTIGAGIATGGAGMTIAAGAVTTAANSVANSKPEIERSGSIGGTSGHLGVLTPYIIMEYPNQSLAKNYMQYDGYPSNIYSVLGDLSGFTATERVWFTSATALSSDIDEIVTLLSGGVIL